MASKQGGTALGTKTAAPTTTTTNKPAAPRPNAWTTPRASPAASPPPKANAAFPPLVNAKQNLSSLAGLTGTTISIQSKGIRYEGVVANVNLSEDAAGLSLGEAKELSADGKSFKDANGKKEPLFISAKDIGEWKSGPAITTNGSANPDSFRTDTDISGKKQQKGGEKELQAWQPDAPTGDDATFDLHGGSSGGKQWDQFAANENLFGVKASFDEDAYTTKLDRSASDYKERERKAMQVANEIMNTTSSNPHIAEERRQNLTGADDSGIGEEDKYSTVTRGQNAYVPPGARRSGSGAPTPPVSSKAGTPAVGAKPGISPIKDNNSDSKIPNVAISGADEKDKEGGKNDSTKMLNDFQNFVTTEKERLKERKKTLVKQEMNSRMADLVKFSQSFKLNKPMPEDLVPILTKDQEKAKQIKDKASADASSGSARNIGVTSPPTTAKVMPKIGPIQEIPPRKPNAQAAKATAGANQAAAKQAAQAQAQQQQAQPSKAKLSASGKPLIPMHIPAIPAFRGKGPPGTNAAPSMQPSKTAPQVNGGANNKLNVGASAFKPNAGAKPFTPSAPSPSPKPASPKVVPKEGPVTPNPFFGNRPIKKTTAHIKDDFNPFKHAKVVDASSITAMWPYSGKRYMQMFPPPPPPQQHAMPIHMAPGTPMMLPQHMPPPGMGMMHPGVPGQQPPPNGQPPTGPSPQNPQHQQQPAQSPHLAMPPPSYEEDQRAQGGSQSQQQQQQQPQQPQQQQQQQPQQPQQPQQTPTPQPAYMYAIPSAPGMYPGYPAYPGMTPGMMPSAPPPPGYAMPPFMPHMYGAPGMPGMPPGMAQPMYAQPGMPTMPPQGFMPPPPGAYPPPPGPGQGPPNGAGGPRPSMPPTPIPAHAQPYWTQSPQLGHAVPYQMMMPPPQGVPQPHPGAPYDQQQQGAGAPAPPVQMGGHA